MANPLENLSRGQQIAVAIGSLGVGTFMVISHHKKTGSWNPFSSGTSSASSATATTSTTTIDPVTGLPVSQDDATDPLTGMTYLAEAQQYGSVQAAESALQFGTTVPGGGNPNYAAGTVVPSSATNPASGVSSTGTYTSNAAWAQAVQAGLVDIGYDPETVSAAIGAYLTGTPVTADQAAIIKTAIAEFGPAPVGNLQVILQPVSTPSSTTSGSSGTSASGGKNPAPKPIKVPGMPSGVTESNVTKDSFVVHWKGVPGADKYQVRVTYQDALVKEVQVGPVSSATVTGLSPNRTYTVHVAAGNSAGWSSETNGPAVKTRI